MAAAEGDIVIVRYIYRGAADEIIPRDATHITVDKDVTVIHEQAFYHHLGIVEIICHDRVEKIGEEAFFGCPNLRRVIMPGVKIVERLAFQMCPVLDVECNKRERIGDGAFLECYSLESINLPSIRIIGEEAFKNCESLTDVKFGRKLEIIEEGAFTICDSLEKITIPLKDGLITEDDIFRGCHNFRHVDLIERSVMQETVASLQLDVWRNDMNREIDSINQTLPAAPVGGWYEYDGNDHYDNGEKARTIRTWIRSVLQKIVHYKAEHRRILSEAATAIQYALPNDILMNNVLPFLALPSHTFERENEKKRKLGSQ